MDTAYTLLYDATREAAQTLLDHAPRDAQVHQLRKLQELVNDPKENHSDTLYLEVERAWGISATLSINFGYGDIVTVDEYHRFTTYEEGKRTDIPIGTMMGVYKPEVKLNWSSTHRSIAEATASIALYSELTQLGALIEARLQHKPIARILRTVEQIAADNAEREKRQAEAKVEAEKKAERDARKAARKATKGA